MPDCFHKAQDDPKYSTLQLQSLLMGVAIGVVLTILLQVRWSFARISPVYCGVPCSLSQSSWFA